MGKVLVYIIFFILEENKDLVIKNGYVVKFYWFLGRGL